MHVPELVFDFSVVIVAAAIFGYLCQRIGLVSIVGYIMAGIIVGPYVLGLIDGVHLVEQMGALLFGGGAIQVRPLGVTPLASLASEIPTGVPR